MELKQPAYLTIYERLKRNIIENSKTKQEEEEIDYYEI